MKTPGVIAQTEDREAILQVLLHLYNPAVPGCPKCEKWAVKFDKDFSKRNFGDAGISLMHLTNHFFREHKEVQ